MTHQQWHYGCGGITVYSSNTTKVLSVTNYQNGWYDTVEMNIYCPPSNGISPNCIIDNKRGYAELTNSNIYAIQGLTDVYIYGNSDTVTLFCNENYGKSCLLKPNSAYAATTDWQCQSGNDDICFATAPPTPTPPGIINLCLYLFVCVTIL